MKTTWLRTGVIVLASLLVAVGSAAAAEPGTVTTGLAYNFDQPDRGFVRIFGLFTSAAPLDLGAPGIQAKLENLLLEQGGGELVHGLPVTVLPRTLSQRVTVFETLIGKTLYRLIVRTCIPTQEACPNLRGLDVGDYEFRIEAVNVLVDSPTQCGPAPGPGVTEFTTRFTIDDGINPAVEVLVEDWPWTCNFRTGRVISVRVP
jgi:hypothetical protein